jgi:uncharacterized membrane protein
LLWLPSSRVRVVALLSLSAFFVLAGGNHFVSPRFYIGIMPAWLPAPRELVYLSGALEVAGGVAVLIPAVRVRSGYALIALLVAVFPANVHMALNPTEFSDIAVALLYARLPLQGVLIAWVFWGTRDDASVHP